MTDAMNAEISLGTVATVGDAVRWLGYTYLFARMQKNPWLYGELSTSDDHHGSYRSIKGCPMMSSGMTHL
jgi:replicative superfamily II helicase